MEEKNQPAYASIKSETKMSAAATATHSAYECMSDTHTHLRVGVRKSNRIKSC